MLTTRICSLLGIDFPIISAPMAGTATAALATSVSKAGAFGMIGSGLNPDPSWVKEQIEAVREKTDLPFCDAFGDCGAARFDVVRLEDPRAGLEGLLENIVYSFTGGEERPGSSP